jgi:hypothetical protein
VVTAPSAIVWYGEEVELATAVLEITVRLLDSTVRLIVADDAKLVV